MMHRIPPLTNNQLHKSNSTSSIWSLGSIIDPLLGELVSSVSTMLHCFPEEDHRILTSRGFLYLTEIESLLSNRESVLYGAYDSNSKQISYSTGELIVNTDNRTSRIINFTHPNDIRNWDSNSDNYGHIDKPGATIKSAHLSIRVTNNHDMFVQLGNKTCNSGASWSKTGGHGSGGLVPYRKMKASELINPANDTAYVRMLAVAEGGIDVADNNNDLEFVTALGLINNEQIDSFLELYGFWLGDGSINYRKNGNGYNSVNFNQVKSGDIGFIRDRLIRLGLKETVNYFIWTGAADGRTICSITDAKWFNYFDNEYGIKYKNSSVGAAVTDRRALLTYKGVNLYDIKSAKWFFYWVFKRLGRRRLRLMLEGVRRADGDWAITNFQSNKQNQNNTNNSDKEARTGNLVIYTSSIRFRDELIVALIHAGYTAYFALYREKGAKTNKATATVDGWRVCYAEPDSNLGKLASYPNMPRKEIKQEENVYTGRTWCVSIEHKDKLIFVQRANAINGVATKCSRPIIVGNCQMMRDSDCSIVKKRMLPYFCEETYTGKLIDSIPTVKSIYQFLKQVFEVGQFNPECCVISLVYINRLIGVTGVPLTQSNWKPVSISALVLAQKVWDDTPLINADFSILYPVLTVQQINSLERKFLDLLEFKLAVSPSLYAQYYFELRSICEENSQHFNSNGGGTGPAGSAAAAAASTGPNKQLQPQSQLSKSVLTRIETRSHLSEDYQKDKHGFKKRTMTCEEISLKNNKIIIS